MLIDRVIFGCGRLTGGATRRQALRIVQTCLDAGVRQFDTAPSYGMGTAETVIGMALRNAGPDVRVTAKVGSARDRWAIPKTWLRRAKRAVSTPRPAGRDDFVPVPPGDGRSGSDFSPAAMERSIAISLDRLGRIDWLLLHEAFAADARPDTCAALEAHAGLLGAHAGYSTGAMFAPDADARFPAGWIAQTAIRPEWLNGTAAAPTRAGLSLHSLVLTGRWLARRDPAFASRLAAAARVVGHGSETTREVAAIYALAASRIPGARLIFSSANEERLRETLAAMASITVARADEIADAWS